MDNMKIFRYSCGALLHSMWRVRVSAFALSQQVAVSFLQQGFASFLQQGFCSPPSGELEGVILAVIDTAIANSERVMMCFISVFFVIFPQRYAKLTNQTKKTTRFNEVAEPLTFVFTSPACHSAVVCNVTFVNFVTF